jgi:hypothetical protein
MTKFETKDYWKALILYGLNQATYKIALGKTLFNLCDQGYTDVPWDVLSKEFLQQYIHRLTTGEAMPQQSIPARRTRMEQIVSAYKSDKLSLDGAISAVGDTAFNDVIHRFHNLGRDESFKGKFYRFDFGKSLNLTDELHKITQTDRNELEDELNARWSLLEGAFCIHQGNFELVNDLRLIYLESGYDRKSLTTNIPFLQGYQGNICFYCGEAISTSDIHVDHVLPRQVVKHDEIWNLVLSHGLCNEQKTDKLVGEHFIRKLIARNENIIGSNHPWKRKIILTLGQTPRDRGSKLRVHYERVKSILGPYYWGGIPSYNPESDPFYRRLITVLNNGEI